MKFFTKNYTEDATVAVSSGAATIPNIDDRYTISQWSSVGSNDTIGEAVSMTWAGFKTFDYICLRNINLAEYAISYWDIGLGAWAAFTPAINVVGNADNTVMHNFTAITTNAILLTSQFTFPANGEKKIGEFMCYQSYVDITDEWLPDNEDFVDYIKKNIHEKANGGSLVIVETMNPKYQNSWDWSLLPKSLAQDVYDMINVHSSVWVLPYEDDPSELINQYYVNIENDYNFKRAEGWVPLTGERCYTGSIEVKAT